MFRISIIVILTLCFIAGLNCGKNKSTDKSSKIIVTKETPVKPVLEEKAYDRTVSETPKERAVSKASGDFFDGGYQTVKGKECGVYIVKTGDDIWNIAWKYCDQIYGAGNYTKKEVGAIAAEINKLNYDNLFCGVNDDLKAGNKVYIEISGK